MLCVRVGLSGALLPVRPSALDGMRTAACLLSEIEVRDQIWLDIDGTQCDPSDLNRICLEQIEQSSSWSSDQQMSFEEVFDEEPRLFLFSRRWLARDQTLSPTDDSIGIDWFDFDKICRPALEYCPEDELADRTRTMFLRVQKVVSQCRGQKLSGEVVYRNMQLHERKQAESIGAFEDAYHDYQQRVCLNESQFEESIQKLAVIEVHDELLSGLWLPLPEASATTLLALIDESRARNVLETCIDEARTISAMKLKVDNGRSEIIELIQSEAERTYKMEPALDILDAIVDRLRELVDDSRDDIDIEGIPSNLHEYLSAESPSGQHLRAALVTLKQIQAESLGYIRERIWSVSVIQSKIRQTSKRLTAYSELLARKATELHALDSIVQLPESYFASLVEVVRRRQFNAVFDSLVLKARNCLGVLYSNELDKRERFKTSYGMYLPQDLFPGITDTPDPVYLPTRSHEMLPRLDSLTDLIVPDDLVLLSQEFFEMIRLQTEPDVADMHNWPLNDAPDTDWRSRLLQVLPTTFQKRLRKEAKAAVAMQQSSPGTQRRLLRSEPRVVDDRAHGRHVQTNRAAVFDPLRQKPKHEDQVGAPPCRNAIAIGDIALFLRNRQGRFMAVQLSVDAASIAPYPVSYWLDPADVPNRDQSVAIGMVRHLDVSDLTATDVTVRIDPLLLP